MRIFSVISTLSLLGFAAAQEQNIYLGAQCTAPGQYSCDTDTVTTMVVCNAERTWVKHIDCGKGCCVAGVAPTCTC